MARRKRTQTWSYKAGKKGHNRVRAYEDGPGGDLFIEYQKPRVDALGNQVLDPVTGEPLYKRQRDSLTAEGITSFAQAVVKAEEMAALIDKIGQEKRQGGGPSALVSAPASEPEPEELILPAGPVLLGPLLDLYEKEVIPTKDPDTQCGNLIAARQFLAFFGRDAVVERIRRDGRPFTELGFVRFHEWMKARREGTIPGFPHKCGRQTIISNFRYLRAVFEWGTMEREDGAPLMVRNPWRKFVPPAEDNPTRVEMTQDMHDRLRAAAGNWRMAVVMTICRETRRRMNSVRNLALTDIDLDARTVTWRAEFDKARKTRTVKVSKRTVEAIREALEHRLADGVADSIWLFPASQDRTRAVPGTSLHNWMKRAKKAAGLNIRGLGFHSEKRAGIRDPMWQQLPEEWREALSGTTIQTEKRIYGYVGLPAMEQAVAWLDGEIASPRAPQPPRKLPMAA